MTSYAAAPGAPAISFNLVPNAHRIATDAESTLR